MKAMKTLALVAVAGFAFGASADVATFDFNIENWGASPVDVINTDFDFEALAGGQIGSINSVSIQLSHSFADDIRFSMTASDGTFFEFLGGEGGSSDLGDGGSDLVGMSTYTFVAAAGNGGFDDFVNGPPIAGGEFDAISWGVGPFGAGSWNLFLRDRFSGDDGAVGSISIDYNLVPAPGSMALLGLGGIVAGRRRR